MNYIKILILAGAIFISSCKTSMKVESESFRTHMQPIRMELRITDSGAKTGNKRRLHFKFYNDFTALDSTIFLSFPCFRENVDLKLFRNGIKQNIQKLVRITGECSKKITAVKAQSSVELDFEYYLDDLFQIDSTAKYILETSYFGIIYLKERKPLKNNQSVILKTIEW